MHGDNGFAGLNGSTGMDTNRMALHRRARAAATTSSETTALSHSATVRAAATASTPTTAPVEVAAAAATSSTFQPGIAASGTATKSVGNAPPTRTKNLNTVPLESYSVSFATQQTAGYSAAAHSSGGVAAGSASSSTGLSQTAIYGIIAGGAALGVILLAVLGVCCWKRKKAKKDDLGWTNLGDKGGGGGGNNIAMLDNPGKNGASAWASTDSFGGGPYASEKPWAQQSFGSLATADEKPAPYGHLPSSHHALPVFSPRDNESARAELFAPSGGQRRHEDGVARSATHDSLASSASPFAPPPPIGRQRSNSNAQSVNDVISFSGQARPLTTSPSTLAQNVPSPPPMPAAPSTPRQQPSTSPPQHMSFNGVAVGPQPITAAYFRPPRPSEVPSAPSSPYAISRRPEVQGGARDTQEIKRDQEVEKRFLEVMTGQVGRDERAEAGERQRSKKDTIVGLTEVYGGEGAEEWGESLPSAWTEQEPDPKTTADQVDIDSPAKGTTAAQLPRRSSSRKRTQTTATNAAPLPSAPPPAAIPRSSPPLSNPNRYSTRVDSKPLRELEELFDRLPPVPPREARVRASEASDYSTMAAHVGGGVRHSDASSLGPYASQPTAQTNGLSFTRRPLGTVPESDSKDSLSPLTASGGLNQSGAHSPYGETSRYEHSIYSAAGEVGELSSSSLASGSPAKGAARTPLGASPLGTPREERALDAGEDVFGGGGAATGLQRKMSTRPSAPTPIRLARNASLGKGQKQSTTPLGSPESTRNPLTLSAAERDVLHALEIPPSSLSYSPLSSGERTPDLSSSIGSTSSFTTPQTPSFSFSPAPAHGGGSDSPTSFLDAAPSPSTSPTANKTSFAFPRSRGNEVEIVDPLVARGGFDSLDAMRAGKNVDAAYRSATMSLYGMYE
ncbi:Proteophosphoglycan ppg4 [Rhodotorula toruloides ATCC 204091]|nr:Proteophosphoglycan ppg4 [Rhodotorula toruloides ATCC 204091]